ncbi:MAG: hypothetical protein QM758_18965 [Armatimonas sp.]
MAQRRQASSEYILVTFFASYRATGEDSMLRKEHGDIGDAHA